MTHVSAGPLSMPIISFKISPKLLSQREIKSISLCKGKLFIFLEKKLTHEKIKLRLIVFLPAMVLFLVTITNKKKRLPETCVTMDGKIYGVKGTKEDEDYENHKKVFSFSFSSSFHFLFGWFFVRCLLLLAREIQKK